MIRRPFASIVALLVGAQTPSLQPGIEAPRAVLLSAAARDSMNLVFRRFNQHWNELSDLNTLERLLGTVRPTQREYLGCLQGTVRGDTVWVQSWQPAADLKQLQLAVAGTCDSVAQLLGTWHTHPYRADQRNLPIKERSLSAQDLKTFKESDDRVMLVMWDVDSIDAAVKDGVELVHPVPVVVANGNRVDHQSNVPRRIDSATVK